MYDIKTLCQRASISQQTFYRLIKENREFGEMAEKGREKRGNSFRYPQSVLDWLLEYYSIQTQDQTEETTESDDTPTEIDKNDTRLKEDFDREKSALLDKISSLEDEIKSLETKIDMLEAKLEGQEQERKALIIQNGQTLLLLSQEKQEKQALLPRPRKSIMERIRSAFKKEKPC